MEYLTHVTEIIFKMVIHPFAPYIATAAPFFLFGYIVGFYRGWYREKQAVEVLYRKALELYAAKIN